MIAPAPRDPRRICLIVLCGLALFSGLTSCAHDPVKEEEKAAREREEAQMKKEGLKAKLTERNEAYYNWQDRRRMRADAREERYQAWWDRIMH